VPQKAKYFFGALKPLSRKIFETQFDSHVLKPWEPVFLTFEQYLIVAALCQNEKVDKENVQEFFSSPVNTNELISSLLKTQIVNVDDRDRLYLLTKQCSTAFLLGRKIIAGENISGRFTRWIANNYKKE
jgi:hypothetical protein